MKYRFGFLTYVSRSGSTFLAQRLNDLKQVCVALECFLPAELFGIKGYSIPTFKTRKEVQAYLEGVWNFTKLSTWGIDIHSTSFYDDISFPIDGKDLVQHLLIMYAKKHKPDATLIIYKGAPVNPWKALEVCNIYSDWHYLHVIRDPRSVYFSQMNLYNPEEKRPFAINEIEVANDWKKAYLSFLNITDAKRLQVKYEDLIIHHQTSINSIIKFLDVSNENSNSSTGYFYSILPENERVIHRNLKDGPIKERISAWKGHLHNKVVFSVQKELEIYLRDMGYEIVITESKYDLYYLYRKIQYFLMLKYYTLKRVLNILYSNPYYFLKKAFLKFN